jgi:hypothetical protein
MLVVQMNQLFFSLFIGSVAAVGFYDTRHNQPTLYNLLRSWPLGSSVDDDRRGERTASSLVLHGFMWVSVALCLIQAALTPR